MGLTIDSISRELEIPKSKLDQYFEALKLVKYQSVMAVRLLAHFSGLLNSYSRALGQVIRLMTRNLYSCLHRAYFSKECWGSLTSLLALAWKELKFWESNIFKLNGFAIYPSTPSITTCEIVTEDASDEGLNAAHLSDKNKTVFFLEN